MAVLRSYVSGRWTSPADGRPVRDAVTGEEVARVSSDGIDIAAALEYGRAGRRPGAAGADLPPAGRAAQGSRHHAARAPRASCTRCRRGPAPPWATRSSTSTAASACCLGYASKARRELPNDTVYVEGAVEPLGRGGQFVGQHMLTPLRGVAVQINAFNFPVWGPLEKFAPAFLAGVPALIKPATQTAYLTARLVELIVESGLLPDGCAAAGLRQRGGTCSTT